MNKRSAIGVGVGILVVLVVVSFSYVAARNAKPADEYGFRPVNAVSQQEVRAVPTGDVEETTLKVSKLSCGSCLYTIESELRKFEGMVGMKADLASGLVLVSHTKDFTPQKIASVITETGYPAELIDQKRAGDLLRERGKGYGGSGCSGCGPRGCGIPLVPPEKG